MEKTSVTDAEQVQTELVCKIAAHIFGDLIRRYDSEIRDKIHNGSPEWREALASDAVRIAREIIWRERSLNPQPTEPHGALRSPVLSHSRNSRR